MLVSVIQYNQVHTPKSTKSAVYIIISKTEESLGLRKMCTLKVFVDTKKTCWKILLDILSELLGKFHFK